MYLALFHSLFPSLPCPLSPLPSLSFSLKDHCRINNRIKHNWSMCYHFLEAAKLKQVDLIGGKSIRWLNTMHICCVRSPSIPAEARWSFLVPSRWMTQRLFVGCCSFTSWQHLRLSWLVTVHTPSDFRVRPGHQHHDLTSPSATSNSIILKLSTRYITLTLTEPVLALSQ